MDYRALIAKYFPPDQVANALAVMAGESGGDPTAHATSGEDSRGLFQINVAPNANPQLASQNLFDPETNIKVAAQMFSQRGWQPWSAARQLGIAGTTPLQGGAPMTEDTGTMGLTPEEQQLLWANSPNAAPYRFKDDKGNVLEYIPMPPGQSGPPAIRMIFQATPDAKATDWSLETGADGNKYFVNAATQEVKPAPELGTKAPAQLAPRYPEDTQLAGINVQKGLLDLQKGQQDLMDPFTLRMQQQAEAFKVIAQQRATGEIDDKEMERRKGFVLASTDAAMSGTTPWQMADADRKRQDALARQQQDTAASLLSNQASTGAGMATSLLSGLGGIYGKILSSSGPPLNFDPMAMSQQYIQQAYGGPQLASSAQAILRGLLGQQQPQGGM